MRGFAEHEADGFAAVRDGTALELEGGSRTEEFWLIQQFRRRVPFTSQTSLCRPFFAVRMCYRRTKACDLLHDGHIDAGRGHHVHNIPCHHDLYRLGNQFVDKLDYGLTQVFGFVLRSIQDVTTSLGVLVFRLDPELG